MLEVVYTSYNMGTWDLSDIYARALGPAALSLGHIYQANSSCPHYNYILHTCDLILENRPSCYIWYFANFKY